jgi:histidinol-phosphate/aromatic aminotransferase/cobyric acid decarboxylase-like protein
MSGSLPGTTGRVRVRDDLAGLTPYGAPQLDVPVRLNTNETPYAVPAEVLDDLAEMVRGLELHRYPDREATELREALALHAGHGFEGTWAANGSNEVLQQELASSSCWPSPAPAARPWSWSRPTPCTPCWPGPPAPPL